MEDRKLVDSKTITGQLIGGFIVYYILLAIIIYFLNLIIITNSLFLDYAILIILDGIAAFLAWRFSIKSAFSKKVISKDEVPKVIKNIFIIVIIVCAINALNSLSQFKEYLDTKKQYDSFGPVLREAVESYIDGFETNNFFAKKSWSQAKLMLKKTEGEIYMLYFSTQIGTFAVYTLAIVLQKKLILKYAV